MDYDFEFAPNPDALGKISSYPSAPSEQLQWLRQLIIHTAQQHAKVNCLSETLKWGQASYVAPQGSTIRLGWSDKQPDYVFVYFTCSSCLVETFAELYGDRLSLIGNRAIALPLDKAPPEDILHHCFSLALDYHNLKHLPLLGC